MGHNLLFHVRILRWLYDVGNVDVAGEHVKHYGHPDHFYVFRSSAFHSGRRRGNLHVFLHVKFEAQIPNAERILDHTSGRVMYRCRRGGRMDALRNRDVGQ